MSKTATRRKPAERGLPEHNIAATSALSTTTNVRILSSG